MDIREKIERAHTGDREARNQLVEENMGLVFHIVKRFSGRGCEEEDLIQIGCIGLIKAVDRFDTSFPVKFSTYAVPMIAGEIKRFLRDDGMIKVSRTVKENYQKVSRAAKELGQELGRNVTLDEIAAATGLTREEIVLAMEAGTEVESIDKIIYESDGRDVSLAEQAVGVKNSVVGYAGEIAVNENGLPADVEKEEILNKIFLAEMLESLEEKEQQILKYRYFHELTQTQVAKILGTSQVQVSRMEAKIIRKLHFFNE